MFTRQPVVDSTPKVRSWTELVQPRCSAKQIQLPRVAGKTKQLQLLRLHTNLQTIFRGGPVSSARVQDGCLMTVDDRGLTSIGSFRQTTIFRAFFQL